MSENVQSQGGDGLFPEARVAQTVEELRTLLAGIPGDVPVEIGMATAVAVSWCDYGTPGSCLLFSEPEDGEQAFAASMLAGMEGIELP